MPTARAILVCGLIVFSVGAAGGAAKSPEVSLAAATVPPVLDGRLDDEAWLGAAHINSFTQVLPRPGEAASERTDAWITYDTGHLYIAVRCHIEHTGPALASQLERDTDFKSDDSVRIVIDPFGRGQDGYYFEVNPLGARVDGLIEHNNGAAEDWDAIWDARAQIDADGWSVEIAIPTTSIAFDPANPDWGFNIERLIRRKQEKVRWSGHSSARDVEYLPDCGVIHGLVDLHQGRGIEFSPFVSIHHTAIATNPADEGTDFSPGFDLLWHITPSLTATFTTFTDFAETEVDDREVNLGRFPLFFPEKRAFFLLDAPLFAFGNIDYNPRPFFSRRIGLTPSGRPVDILAGFKLTGRQGPFTIGLLDTQVDSYDGVESKNLFAGRFAVQLSEGLSAGVLATRGEPRANGNNSTIGADLNYAFTRLPKDRSLEIHTWVVGTDSDLAGGSDTAGAIQLLYPNEPFDLELFAGRYGERYDPGLGFASRTGIYTYSGSGGWRWRNPNAATRKIDARANFEFISGLDGRIESEDHEVSVSWENRTNDEVEVGAEFERDRLDEPFEIRPGNIIPVGDYRFTRYSLGLDFNPSRSFSGSLSAKTGEFYNGRRDDYEVEVEWRPSAHVHIGASYELRSVRLPGGNFDVRLSTVNLAILFSTALSLNTLAQYDNASNELGLNVRLKWIVGPGREIFLVLNEGYDVDGGRFAPRQSDLTAKAAWTYLF